MSCSNCLCLVRTWEVKTCADISRVKSSGVEPIPPNEKRTDFSSSKEKFRYTLLAKTSENTLINLMKMLPSDVELSSLPIFKDNKASVELSLSGYENLKVKHYFELFCKELDDKRIEYI